MDDRELIERLTNRIDAPTYLRIVVPAAALCRRFGFTKQQISNWVARSDRTGVHRYPGGYDPNEILRWTVIRGERATRRDRRSA